MYPGYKISLLLMPTPLQYLILLTFAISHEVFLKGWRGVWLSDTTIMMLLRRTKKKVLFFVIGFFSVCVLLLTIMSNDSGTEHHSLRHEDDVTITSKSQLFMNTCVCTNLCFN